MKRVVFAVTLLVLVIAFNCFCLFTITKTKDEATEKLIFLEYTVSVGNAEKTALECEKFSEYWLSAHHTLGRIVRHELLDQATASAARFVPLAKYGEYGELASEISKCRLLLEEIWDSERPLLRNIL